MGYLQPRLSAVPELPEVEALALDLKGIGVSAGSACTSGNVEPSYVLVAMGLPLDWAMGSVRCSLGRGTAAEDIEYVIESVVPLVAKLKTQSPVAGAAPVVGSSKV